LERGVDGKFKSSAPPGALTSGEDARGAGKTRYEEPAEVLTTPVAAASMPALLSGAGHKNAENAPMKNDESAEVQTRGAGEGGGGTNDFTCVVARGVPVEAPSAYSCGGAEERE
jgi:hypothetical protein